jgi:glutamyl-tRNA synthetase
LYRSFGWEMPKIAHLPLLRNADKSKLSKRKNPTGIFFYKRMGYLPEALANFLGLFSVPPVDGEELMDLATMIERFDTKHISLGGPVFDVKKLDWLNGRYLRERLDTSQFLERVEAWSGGATVFARIAALAQRRIERLSDLGLLCAFLFAGRLDVTADQLRGSGKLDDQTLRKAFVLAQALFDVLPDWDVEAISGAITQVAALLDAKVRDAVRPFYVAIAGSPQSLPLYDSMVLLGRDLVRERLRVALAQLGGATNAEQQAWKKLLGGAAEE